MRSLVLLPACILLLTVLLTDALPTERDYQLSFVKYIKHYNKHYSAIDYHTRYATFKRNMDVIDAHNQQTNATFRMAVNHFTDMEPTEFAARRNGWRPAETDADPSTEEKVTVRDPPASLDWRSKGVVTGVKDQGMCGSCWAFSATGAMESAVAIADHNLTSLSEQQLMDCDTFSSSCEGGSTTSAFLYAVLNGGVCSEASYPYKGVDESPCRSCTTVSKISAYKTVFFDGPNPTDDKYLMAAVQLGPVSVVVEADQDSWQKYESGVITSASCGTALDHGVLVVGYDTDKKSGLDYWIVKNSWGAQWGQNGYVWLARGQNTCGINQKASYPVA